MAQLHEWAFYETMWRAWTTGAPMPLPWWVQQHFRRWLEPYDEGLFESKHAAFASNALYRYWSVVGVKDAAQETLVGQAGELEPVYDRYALSFFLFDPATRAISFAQHWRPEAGEALEQTLEEGYLPVVRTRHRSALGVTVDERAFATVAGPDRKVVTFARFDVSLDAAAQRTLWFGLAVGAAGPSGFQRHDRAGRYLEDGRLTFLRYLPAQRRVEVGTSPGPIFDAAPAAYGLYGGRGSPDEYLRENPFADLQVKGALNGAAVASDSAAGLCSAAFVWPVTLVPGAPAFRLDVRLPVDDFRGDTELATVGAEGIDGLERSNLDFWRRKLDQNGMQATLPRAAGGLAKLYKTCRANLLILADDGQIHPGPTLYDSFWVRDSSVEGIACALAGDVGLAERQFGWHYPAVFNQGPGAIGPARLHGFIGGAHEKGDREWDANGEALWAIGRFDRIRGAAEAIGQKLFQPMVVEGARWLRDCRDGFGLLHAGWSAEHLGGRETPHYWDDLWGIAGLWEAARLAERIGATERGELWGAYDALRDATRDSILWVLARQRERGEWQTYIPTGPADVGRCDSTMIGAMAYFHPCRLHMGAKLGAEADAAARMTAWTVYHRFVRGGLEHEPWNAFGPYLTLQLAHAFLFMGALPEMERCLAWAMEAAFARLSASSAAAGAGWRAVQGAWNEQHCYPVATDFARFPADHWYMGDIPHGWACAELMLLLRDMLLFEADEDGDRHMYVAAGLPAAWLASEEPVEVRDAPTTFGVPFGYRLEHDTAKRELALTVTQPIEGVRLVLPVRVGARVLSATADGRAVPVMGRDVAFPAGTKRAVVAYGAG